jgi:SAM-dependent methyltransferase
MMNDTQERVFTKYGKKGAYHWTDIGISLRRHNCYTAARYAVVLELLGDCRGKAVLDVGCGDGALTYLLYRRHAKVAGCEPEPNGRALAVEMFRRRGAIATFAAELADFPSAAFDAVVMADVIEHVTDRGKLLEEIQRVLLPGGRLITSTPVRLTETPVDREHVHEFWPGEFRQFIAQYFEVAEQRFDLSLYWNQVYHGRWLGLPVPRIVMNACSAWFGVRLIARRSQWPDYPTLQTIVAVKRPAANDLSNLGGEGP